ncbi:MAG: choice-of-anchor M domain-containing protein [Microbacterium sp.]
MTTPQRRVRRSRKFVSAGALLALVIVMGTPLSALAAQDSALDEGAPVVQVSPVDEVPPPPGQSHEPAPQSRAKTVVGNVHTDAVSAYLDSGELVLDSKVDMDVTGDGVVDLGSRLAARETIFHLSDKGRTQIPALSAYSFLGTAGSTIWLAPQTQNHEIIWPGFSTEDPRLDGQVTSGRLDVRLRDAQGPGEVEVYLQNGSIVNRVFSSTTTLPAWSTGVPQHTHMNWAFTSAGTYTLTFEMSGTVGGRVQVAQNEYTFVVGDLGQHTQATTTTLEASASAVAAGEPILLSAQVSPRGAAGAVQFRDSVSDRLLGHTPVVDGNASLQTSALTPGEHRLVAEFVPTWSTDHLPSASPAVTVTIEGEVVPKPDVDDSTPPDETHFAAHAPGEGLVITALGKTVPVAGTLSARASAAQARGRWLSVWVSGSKTSWQGWVQADLVGGFTVALPQHIGAGMHRLAIEDEAGEFLGWDGFTVTTAVSEGGQTPIPPPPSPAGPVPAAPSQQCVPSIVLDSGHVDAFFVSAASGAAVLQLMEDVTGHRVIREAESVLLRVKESAYRANIPAGTPGAPAGYVLPLTQNPGLLWPGWDTNRTAASGFSDVSIHITGVNGPGRVHLSSQGSFGGVESLLQSGGYTLPGTIREAAPAHTHAQWVFSDKGIYKLSVHAVAVNPTTGAALRTSSHTYVFQVGDVPLGDAFCGLRSADADAAKAVNAAVNAAAADAVAAAQAAAAITADSEAPERRERRVIGSDEAVDALPVADSDLPFVMGIVAGGVLIVGGIVGLTVWYLRRLRVAGPLTNSGV